MRLILALTITLALAWSGYWLWGARAVDRNLANWLDQRHQSGWVAHWSDVKTRGYPNRFDTTLTDIELADPSTGVAWTAPFFQIFRLSYEPRHIIAVWPNSQSFAIPGERIDIATTDARASLVFLDADWTLERATATAENIRLTASTGWTAQIASARLASRPSERRPGATNIGLEVADMRPASPALAKLSEMNMVPGRIERIQLDASVTFDAPWDRRAVEDRRPNVTAIDLHLLQTTWGHLDLWAAGDVTVDPQGRLTGSITLKLKNWREMLTLLNTTGWMSDGVANTLETGLTLLAGLSGSKKTLDLPLTFASGDMSFGPINLGAAPRIKMR